MYVLGADKNVAAVFSNGGRLWGAMHWAPLGILTKFVQRGGLTANTAPYRFAGAFGTPGSIVVRHPVEVAMHFVTQMYTFRCCLREQMTPTFFLGRSLEEHVHYPVDHAIYTPIQK